MKNIFRFLGGLMCACALFTACSEDEPIVPEFPTSQVVKSVQAGEVVTISIKPNLNWEVSINEDEATYFQLLDGANSVYKLRGMAGSHDIKVQVADLIDMDEDHVCEVSLTMENQTEVIAVLTLGKINREISIYPVKIDEYGAFEYATDTESELTYAYESAVVGESGVALTWPDGMNGFMGRVKVVSNFDWTVDGTPEWIKPIEGGNAGETELWIQADPTKYPMEASDATLKFVDANNSEAVATTLKVSIPAASDMLSVSGFAEVSKFNAAGQAFNTLLGDYMDGTVNGMITSTDGVQILALAFAEQWGMMMPEQPAWVTLTVDEWNTAEDAGVIQQRGLHVGVTANESSARKAYVFVLPADMSTDIYEMSEFEGGMPTGNIAEAYLPYLVTTVEQESAPATLSYTNAAMEEIAFKAVEGGSWPFTELGNAKEFYELLYTKQWDCEDTMFNSTKEISNIYISILDANGNFYDVENDQEYSWVTYWKNGAGTSFKVNMNPSHATAANALNLNTNDYEAGLYIEYADGSGAIIYLRYNEAATVGGDGVSLAFAYPGYAADIDGSTLVELTEGDVYNKYKDYGAPVWHVTFTSAGHTMSMLTGISTDWPHMIENEADAEWLSYEGGLEYQMIMTAEAGNGKTGAILFGDGMGGIKLVLVCTLNIAE